MPVLCFVLDTSASMNRRTQTGQRLIDLAKTAIDNFLKKVFIPFFQKLRPRLFLAPRRETNNSLKNKTCAQKTKGGPSQRANSGVREKNRKTELMNYSNESKDRNSKKALEVLRRFRGNKTLARAGP